MRRALALLVLVALAVPPASQAGSVEEDRAAAIHVLNRAAFGPRPGDVEQILEVGVERWIEAQLHPEAIEDDSLETRLRAYPTLGLTDDAIAREYIEPLLEKRRARRRASMRDEDAAAPPPRPPRPSRADRQHERRIVVEASSARILRAAESERQLNEVMVDFWMNHFNVFAGKALDRYMVGSFEERTIRPHIWGRFEDLLLATGQSPAMLFYLDNAQSVAAPEMRPRRPQRRSRRGRPDAARRAGGLNENYARELLELHTLGVDGGYTQKDVTELARILTGWSIARPGDGSGFVFRAYAHDRGSKTLLGKTFEAGGQREGEAAIRMLANHPSTAKFLATKLCRKLVADDPPPALVERVAKRYLETRGDLRETVRAILTSPEFLSPAYRSVKTKTPFEYVVSAIRATGSEIEDPRPLILALRDLGQPLYGAQPPTGWPETADAWISSGALVGRLNFAIALAAEKVPGVRPSLPEEASASELATMLVGSELSEATRQTIEEQKEADARIVTALILGSPEFQRQ